jgi:hypothetical protein
MVGINIQKLQKLPRLLTSIFCVLFVFNLLTIIISYKTGYHSVYGLLDQFNFNKEGNIPTYYSLINLLLAAVLLFSIYSNDKINNLGDRKYWLSLSIIFLYLSIDESAKIHEMLTRPMGEILNLFSISSRWLFFPWVIVGIIIVLVLAVYLLKFYLHLPLRFKLLFGISAALFVGGAIGMEIIDGFFAAYYSEDSLTYHLLTTLEESMEMIGAIVFIKALIDYLQSLQLKTDVIKSSSLKAEI